jgi:hypothetical protein
MPSSGAKSGKWLTWLILGSAILILIVVFADPGLSRYELVDRIAAITLGLIGAAILLVFKPPRLGS